MRTVIDNSGKLEIPQELRERARLVPGAEVDVELSSAGGVHVRPIPATPSNAPSNGGGQSSPRLEREGSVLVVSGLTYGGPWDDLVARIRHDQLNRSQAGTRADEDAL